MDLRTAALAVLDGLEQHLLKLSDDNQLVRLSAAEAVEIVADPLAVLCALACSKGDLIHERGEASSQMFLKEISSLPKAQLLQKLAERDSTVICWRGDFITLGPAAGELRGNADPDGENSLPKDSPFAPQLFRLYNLHCLATELSGESNPGLRHPPYTW